VASGNQGINQGKTLSLLPAMESPMMSGYGKAVINERDIVSRRTARHKKMVWEDHEILFEVISVFVHDGWAVSPKKEIFVPLCQANRCREAIHSKQEGIALCMT
jgi:hypothetical protein